MIKGILEKSPLNFAIVRALCCINPRKIKLKLKIVLTHLVDIKYLKESDCDEILQEFNEFLSNVVSTNSDVFTEFKPSASRIDSFLYSHMGNEKGGYLKLWGVIKQILFTSHG